MKKKLTALVLSLVIAAMPAAAPVMNVQTVSAATTKAAVLKNTWSKDHIERSLVIIRKETKTAKK